jgi:hypothetical protein
VQSLQEFSQPHPLSTEAAVSSLKRYLSDNKFIQLDDLISEEAKAVRKSVTGGPFNENPPTPETAFKRRVEQYEAACSTLLSMATIGSFYAEARHVERWRQALQLLCLPHLVPGQSKTWYELQRYPAILLLYALGLGALAGSRLTFLREILLTPVKSEDGGEKLSVAELAPYWALPDTKRVSEYLYNSGYATPLNDRISMALKPHILRVLTNEENYGFLFDKLEILAALTCDYNFNKEDIFNGPYGCYIYEKDLRRRVVAEIKVSIQKHSDNSDFVQSQLFGRSADECNKRLDQFEMFSRRARLH